MHFLILCILSSTGIFIVFRSLERFSIPSFPIIVINYLTATVLGFAINRTGFDIQTIINSNWLSMSILIGILFILMFFLVALSSRRAGISVTTVAAKMSVILPIIFSMVLDPADKINLWKSVAIISALCGVFLTVYKPGKKSVNRAVLYIPLILFVGMGIVDSLVKFAQFRFVNDPDTALFSGVLFLNAFLTGVVILIFTPRYLPHFVKPSRWGWGVLLGGVNFGSIYFLMRALNYVAPSGRGIDSSVIFGVNNTGIVALSILAGLILFRERLSLINWVGVSLSALALILFSFG
jgi:drug/metabolite transporter (DMT)-like permease